MLKKKIGVIGLGDFGLALVRALHHAGHEVTAIDRKMEVIESVSDYCTHPVCLDSTDERALKSQGVEDLEDVIIAAADDFETLIVTADILKRICRGRITVRYRTPLQMKILEMLGLRAIFNPEEKAAINMSEQFGYRGLRQNTILSDEYKVIEVAAPASLIDVPLARSGLKTKYRLNLITIKRVKQGETVEKIIGIPEGNTVVRKNDILILFGHNHDIEHFLDDSV